MKQHSMNVKETGNANYVVLPSDKNDSNEAYSRIIQRLTAVGIIKPEDLTEVQRNVIFELCGLDKLKTYS